ncbi:hypothetical protein B0T19DRAFT_444866 [Cercophora scortea]|uniref:Uncharacterized protein n=1 Tax=Cercophora scortea TaxID=314031 RepID=A0AAE0M7S4_9PEZI|nr:hypothetical protein B0T19DRAFT_444866 [Cercophora scortea]
MTNARKATGAGGATVTVPSGGAATSEGVENDADATTADKRPAPAAEEAPAAKKPKPFTADYAKSMVGKFQSRVKACECEMTRLKIERDFCIKEGAERAFEEDADGNVDNLWEKAVLDLSPGCPRFNNADIHQGEGRARQTL